MPPKESAETQHALYLREQGKTVSEACRLAGIVPSTFHRAMNRRTKKKVKK